MSEMPVAGVQANIAFMREEKSMIKCEFYTDGQEREPEYLQQAFSEFGGETPWG